MIGFFLNYSLDQLLEVADCSKSTTNTSQTDLNLIFWRFVFLKLEDLTLKNYSSENLVSKLNN